jgi:hypothetical protein
VSTVEAATALTGGIRATANDASGNRYIIAGAGNGAAYPIVNDLVNGGLYISGTSAVSMQVGIGCEILGSSATTPNVGARVLDQYFAVTNEVVRVVNR